MFSLQCSDTVGWATGGASGLGKAGCWFVGGDRSFARLIAPVVTTNSYPSPPPFRLAASVSCAGHEKRSGEQLKWSLHLGCTLVVFHVNSYQDQFIQPCWAECFFVFPWAVESSATLNSTTPYHRPYTQYVLTAIFPG